MKRTVNATLPTQPATASTPLATLEVLDDDAIKNIDPLVPRAFPFWSPLTEPADITKGGKVIARIAPTDAGQQDARGLGLSLDMYELLVSSIGSPDSKETSTRWLAEGTKAVRDVMRHVPSHSLPRWRGEHTAIVRMAQNVARAYLLPGETIAQLTGAPFESRPGLFAPGFYAKRLETQALEREEQEAKKRAALEASERERTRARSVGELAVDGVVVKRGRLVAATEAPFHGAIPAWEDGASVAYAWPKLAGLTLPPFDEDGVRALKREELVPAGARLAKDVSGPNATFVMEMRARFGTHDRGPIPREKLGLAGLDLAHEFIASRGSWLIFSPASMHLAWRQRHAIECLVRGHLLPPELAAELAIAARDEAHRQAFPDAVFDTRFAAAERANAAAQPPNEEWTQIGEMPHPNGPIPLLVRDEPRAIPTSFVVPSLARLPVSQLSTDSLSALAVAAVASGSVGAGELLALSEQPATGKKGKR